MMFLVDLHLAGGIGRIIFREGVNFLNHPFLQRYYDFTSSVISSLHVTSNPFPHFFIIKRHKYFAVLRALNVQLMIFRFIKGNQQATSNDFKWLQTNNFKRLILWFYPLLTRPYQLNVPQKSIYTGKKFTLYLRFQALIEVIFEKTPNFKLEWIIYQRRI